MGVKGLKNFISQHTTGALVSKNISKCRLLIDGANLMYFLYHEHTKTNVAFGGDYDAFVDQVDIFFNALDQCSIESCVIMDGGVSLRKCSIQNGIRSFRCNTFGALNVTPEDPTEVVPALLRSVFISAVRRCGVTVLQADDIADDELCTLSATFGLPVLSSDTDFCLRGIPVIVLSSFDYRELKQEETVVEGQLQSNSFIEGQVFNKETFCKLLDINPEHILLLTTLGMHDNLAQFSLKGFVYAISKGLIRDRNWTDRLFAINAVRRWLSQHKDTPLPQLVKMVVDLHPNYERPRKMEQLEQLLLRVVQVSPFSSKLLPWFSAGPDDLPCGHAAFVSSCPSPPPPGTDPLVWASVSPELMRLHRDKRQRVAQLTSAVMLEEMKRAQGGECCPHADTELNFAGGLALPRWFAVAQKQALVHFDAAELLVKKTVFTNPMVEKMNRNSAYLVALPVVEVIMAICEKTYLEQERLFLHEQMDMLKQNDCQLDEQVRKTIESQIIEYQVNHIQYMKALKKMNRKKKKETAAMDRKPKFRMDWQIEEEKKKKRALKKKNKDKASKKSEVGTRNPDDDSGADSPPSEDLKTCHVRPEKRQPQPALEGQTPHSNRLKEDVDDIKNLQLDAANDEVTNFDIEEVGKGSIDDYLGWFKSSKNYHAPQILDSDSVRERGNEEENCHNSCSEDDSLKTNESSHPSLAEIESQSRSILDDGATREIPSVVEHEEQLCVMPSVVEHEEQLCVTPAGAGCTVQPLSDSQLEEQDDALGAESDEDGSIYEEDELMNMATSAFFGDKEGSSLDYDERYYRGKRNSRESSFNFDTSGLIQHQEWNDASGWANDNDSDVIIEEDSDDDSGAMATPAHTSRTANITLPLQSESTVVEQLLLARNDESAAIYDYGLQSKQMECCPAGKDDSDVIVEESGEESVTIQNGIIVEKSGEESVISQNGIIVEKSEEESVRNHNGASSEPVVNGSLIGSDEQLNKESRLIEKHQESGSAATPGYTVDERINRREQSFDRSNSSSSPDDTAHHDQSGTPRLRNFLKGGSKPKYTKTQKPKNYVTPLSEKKRKTNKRNSSLVDENSLNVSNPTDNSVGADDSLQLPVHLTTGECEVKNFKDADFQILFSGHCLKLEVKQTSFSPEIMSQLQKYYQSVCDASKQDIIIISDALKRGDDVESARDMLLERLNDRLMKNVRSSLEKECDRILLLEGQEMSDNDYNTCFMNGALQKLDVLKVIPYRERPFKWYIRKSFLRSLFVLKLKNEANLSSVPSLQDLSSKTFVQRKGLVCDFLNEPLNTYNCLPGDLQLVLMSISYWYSHSSLRLNRCHVYVLLLSFVMFYFVDPVVGRERDPVKLKALLEEEEKKLKGKKKKNPLQLRSGSANHNIAFIAGHMDRYSCVLAANRLAEYHKVNKDVTAGKLKKHYVHSLCEFQACFNYIGALNSFLGSPFSFPSIEQVLNCTFAYNAFKELSGSKFQGTVISTRLGEKMQMTYLFDALHQFVGKAINMPMVLDLYPKLVQTVNKKGEVIKKHVGSINLSEKLKKEQARIEKENEVAQLDALAKEFEELDMRKAHQAKRKAALEHKQMSSTPKCSQVASKKSVRAKNKRNFMSELESI